MPVYFWKELIMNLDKIYTKALKAGSVTIRKGWSFTTMLPLKI